MDQLPFQRWELALKMKGIIREKAKANCSAGEGDKKTGLQKSKSPMEPVHTDEELSQMAGVSRFNMKSALKYVILCLKTLKLVLTRTR